MSTFALRINLADGSVTQAAGFDQPVRHEPEARLLALSRFDRGPFTFFLAGRWYSLRSEAELGAWLDRFDPDRIETWFKEQDGDCQVIVWDRERRRVYLVSDRTGSWRAYYAAEDGCAMIANRRTAMVGLLARPAICQYAFYQLLTVGFVIDPWSLLEGVRVTHPGQVVTIDGRGTTVRTYWTPVNLAAEYYATEAECLSALDGAARQVFAKRLSRARLPVVLLSGGLDSMTMLAYLSELSPGRVHTLTFSLAGMERNECAPARRAARHFGSEHQELEVNPAEGARLLLRVLSGADTWNYAALYSTAEREYLEKQGGLFDVFTGEDARLHTPSFDTPKELGIHINRNRLGRLEAPAWRLAAGLLARMPVWGAVKNYGLYWSKHLTPRRDFPAYFLAGLMGHTLPADLAVSANGHYARLLADLPGVNEADGLQEVYKKYAGFNIRAQHTDDMNTGTSSMNGDSTELHHPFFDWQLVEVFNRLPYRLAARRTFTFKAHSKMPIVQKYLLRKLVQKRLPDDILYRQKGTNPSLHCFFNHSLRSVVGRMLHRWLPSLVEGLDQELADIVTAYRELFQGKPTFVRSVDELLLVRVLCINYVALLHHLCTHRTITATQALAALEEEPVSA